jgi:hypothetical protein
VKDIVIDWNLNVPTVVEIRQEERCLRIKIIQGGGE